MKNFIQVGGIVDFTLGFDVTGGVAYYINDIVVVACQSVKAGKRAPMLTQGVVELPKNPSEAFAQGQILYWDNTNKSLTLTAAANKRFGFTVEPALAGDPNVKVFFYALS